MFIVQYLCFKISLSVFMFQKIRIVPFKILQTKNTNPITKQNMVVLLCHDSHKLLIPTPIFSFKLLSIKCSENTGISLWSFCIWLFIQI